jgi:DNA-binding HxlR family transcriptional regulator
MYDEESRLVEDTLDLIAGKWRLSIVCNLSENGPTRFNELRKRLPGLSQRVLTTQLKRLEKEGLITREEFGEVPPRVEYSLTQAGHDLEKVIVSIYEWGEKYVQKKGVR